MLEDFFSYGSECTADDLCDALDAMNELWGRILYDSRRHMLVMSSEDDEVTRLTLRYLAPFAKARRVRCGFILVASDRRIGEMARRYATAPYRIEYCDRDIIEKLGRVLSVSTYSSILSFNSLDLTTDNDAYELVRRGLLSKEEVLALACLQLDYVPDERETDESRKEFERTFPGEDAIDWKLYPPAPYRGSTTDIFERILENPGIGKDDQVFISGAVRSSIMLAERMHNFNIFGIIDNNKAKQGTEYEGLMVYAPEELDEKFGRDIRIIVHTRHFREICEQLSRLGYEMGKQVFPAYVADDPYFRTEMLKSSIRCIYKSGKAVYDRVRERCPDELLIHLPYSGTGDAYLAGMYMEDMIRIHHLPDSIFIVRSEACRKILGLFGYESEVLDEAGSDSLIKYARIVGFKTANYIMLNDSYDFRTSIRLRGINGIDFHTMFQISVFKVPEKRRIPVGIRQDNADDLIEEHGLEPGNTVIISPYATTADSLSDEVWESMVKDLDDMGFKVCTNVASGNEKPIDGTTGVFIPYAKLKDFVNKCGYFIGLRSGLCDIISSTSARKIVIYPSFIGNEMHTPHFALIYFGLKNMALCGEEIYEAEFDRDGEREFGNKISRYVRKEWRQ